MHDELMNFCVYLYSLHFLPHPIPLLNSSTGTLLSLPCKIYNQLRGSIVAITIILRIQREDQKLKIKINERELPFQLTETSKNRNLQMSLPWVN